MLAFKWCFIAVLEIFICLHFPILRAYQCGVTAPPGACNYYASNGYPECENCIAGSASPGATDCIYTGYSYVCTPCTAGTYSDLDEASSCTDCPAGYYSDSGATQCTACPPGSISAPASASCQTTCPAGQGIEDASSSYSQSDESCGNCSPGYYNNGDSLYCTACPAGTFSSLDASSCSSTCPAGTGVESTSDPSSSQSKSPYTCGYCNIGYANNGSSIYCSPCSSGMVATTVGSSSCTLCPAGSGVDNADSSSTSTSALICAACSEGHFQSGNSIYCSACSTGSISNGEGAVNCTSTCTAGKGIYSDSSSLSTSLQVCSNCSMGYYHSPNVASLTCTACPLGTAASINGSYACTVCSDSKAANSVIAATECVSTCPSGSGAQQGHSSQSTSNEACGSCLQGFYQSGNQLFCTECTATQYTSSIASTGYKTCTFPRQSYFQYYWSSSGEYHACQALSLGLTVKSVLAIIAALVGFIVFVFVIAVPQGQKHSSTLDCSIQNKQDNADERESHSESKSFDYTSNNANKVTSTAGSPSANNSKWNMSVVLFAYCFIPIFDFCSDLAYILSVQYYSWALFLLSCGAIALPMAVFFARLLRRRAFAKFRFWTMPASLFFDKYDNIFKLIITALASIPYIIINMPVVIPLGIAGVLLNATKLIAIVPISNIWYEIWTGGLNFRNEEAIIDTQVLNESIYTGIFCQTFFHLLVQGINNTLLHRWDTVAYISFIAGGLNAVNGIYQVLYYKFFLKQSLFNRPVTLTFGGLLKLPASLEIPATKNSTIVPRATDDGSSMVEDNQRTLQQQKIRGSDVEMRSSDLSIMSNPIHHAKVAVTKGMLTSFKKEVHGELEEKISREEMRAELEAVKKQLARLQQSIVANGGCVEPVQDVSGEEFENKI